MLLHVLNMYLCQLDQRYQHMEGIWQEKCFLLILSSAYLRFLSQDGIFSTGTNLCTKCLVDTCRCELLREVSSCEAVAQYTAVLSACRLQFKKGTFKRLRCFFCFCFFYIRVYFSVLRRALLIADGDSGQDAFLCSLQSVALSSKRLPSYTHTHTCVRKQHTLILTCQPGGPASNTSDGWHEMVAWKKTTTSLIQIYDMGCRNWAPFLLFLSPRPSGPR